jgi:hypothetical protein
MHSLAATTMGRQRLRDSSIFQVPALPLKSGAEKSFEFPNNGSRNRLLAMLSPANRSN